MTDTSALPLLALTVAAVLSGCIGPNPGVDGWKCVVTQQDPRVDQSGGGAVFEDGNCAVLHAGCRRQEACELVEMQGEENAWYLVSLNIGDPEIQERLRGMHNSRLNDGAGGK